MKIIKIFVLIFILSAFLSDFCISATDEGLPKIGFIKNDEANVRAGDNINFETLCKLKKGDPVKIIGERYSWFKILLPKTAYVYIKSDYIELDYEKGNTGTVNAIHVNLRAGPDTKYSIVGQVSEPEKVQIISEENGWYKIEPPAGTTGWIHSNLVSFDLELVDLSKAKEDNVSAVKNETIKAAKEEAIRREAPLIPAPTKKKEKGSVILKSTAAEPKGNLIFSTQGNQ